MTRGGAAAARQAHNLEVRGSSPLPATNLRTSRRRPRPWRPRLRS
ncbi:hypothetical protein LCGC14_2977340, partial [marine sediment metagenome]